VSATTVSHALNGKGRVEATTRERITQLANELGYQPFPAARALQTGRTMSIGILGTFGSTDPRFEVERMYWYTRTALAAAEHALRRGYTLVLAPLSEQPHWQTAAALDGLLVVGTGMSVHSAAPAMGGLPTVIIEGDPDTNPTGVVAADPRAATRMALNHLKQRGARRPAVVLDQRDRWSTRATAATYQVWCQEAGLDPLLLRVEINRGWDHAFRHCLDLLDQSDSAGTGLDAAYIPVDSAASPFIAALELRGLPVPNAFRVVTSDGFVATHSSIRFTAIDVRREDAARKAVEMLIDELTILVPSPSTGFEPRLIVRDST